MKEKGQGDTSRYRPLYRSWWIEGVLIGLLLLIFVHCGLRAARTASVTFDEFVHVPAGVAYWKEQAFLIYAQNPPLARLIATLPILNDASLPPVDETRLHDSIYRWWFGNQFLLANWQEGEYSASLRNLESSISERSHESQYDVLFFRARVPILILGLILGGVIYVWSRMIFGTTGALVSLGLYSFSPTVLAHTSLATTDMALALFATVTVFCGWYYYSRPSWTRGILLGVLFGLALGTKFTAWLLVLPVFIAVAGGQALQWGSPARRQRTKTLFKGATLAVVSIVALMVLNACYGFQDVFRPLGDFTFLSQKMRFLQALVPDVVPCPVAAAHIIGLDWLLDLGERGEATTYLLGQTLSHGSFLYFPVALAVKVTLPVLVLWAVAVFLLVHGWLTQRWKVDSGDRYENPQKADVFLFVLLPPLFFFAVLVVMRMSNYGIRYALFCFPFLFVATGAVVRIARKPWLKAFLSLLMGWHVISSFYIAPDYLAYFNELAGGPRGGIHILADSNIDWSQQLKALKGYMEKKGMKRIALSYCGSVNPLVYDIHWIPFKQGKVKGPVAISANHLVGLFPFRGKFGGGIQDFSVLLATEPEEILGHSMYIYDID